MIYGEKVLSRLIDLTGQKFSRLIVVERASNSRSGRVRWLCRCDCGKQIVVHGSALRICHTQSCGCLQKERTSKANYVHGHAINKSCTYISWKHMMQRCYNSKNKRYKDYGGRGIKVCDRWQELNGQGFINFLQDMGKRPPNLTLDRVDNNGNYCKANCRWATPKIQNCNQRSNILITINDKTQCLSEWCYELGLKYHTVYVRIYQYKWSIEKALELK